MAASDSAYDPPFRPVERHCSFPPVPADGASDFAREAYTHADMPMGKSKKSTCCCVVTVNQSPITLDSYALGHFNNFIRPGA